MSETAFYVLVAVGHFTLHILLELIRIEIAEYSQAPILPKRHRSSVH